MLSNIIIKSLNSEECVEMTATYRKLNLNKLKSRKHHVISSSTALKDVTPIKWSDEVLTGKKEIIISK